MSVIDDLSDQEVVGKTIFGEASNQSYIGQQAVANVIQNRVAKPGWWGNDFRSVCLKPYQFSCWLASDPNSSRIMEVDPENAVYQQCMAIAGLAMADQLHDVTNGATSYYAITMGNPPGWARGKTPCATIGEHIFFQV